jgi:hypothetical protein
MRNIFTISLISSLITFKTPQKYRKIKQKQTYNTTTQPPETRLFLRPKTDKQYNPPKPSKQQPCTKKYLISAKVVPS